MQSACVASRRRQNVPSVPRVVRRSPDRRTRRAGMQRVALLSRAMRRAIRRAGERMAEANNMLDGRVSILNAPNTSVGDAASSEDGFFSRLERIMGREGLERLTTSTVMVLGVGGVGSNCIEALARGGVGRLVIVDHDVVQESNINRQAIAFRSTLGLPKVEAMRRMIADINPDAQVEALQRFVLAQDVPALLDEYAGRVDYVVDAIDTVSAKLAIAEYADAHDMRLISSMGAANKLHPECLCVADVFDTVNCPLSRIMRKEARKRGIKRLKVLYSCEQPVKVAVREGAERRERSNLGTASFMPPIMGQMIAGQVIRELVGLE